MGELLQLPPTARSLGRPNSVRTAYCQDETELVTGVLGIYTNALANIPGRVRRGNGCHTGSATVAIEDALPSVECQRKIDPGSDKQMFKGHRDKSFRRSVSTF